MLQLPRVIAHRGASAYAPENTLAAMRKAHSMGAQWVEFDVMLASCGELVVIHDETLRRTTNGKGRVADIPYSEIAKLDAGSWFAPEFAQEKVPTFVQLLQCAAELGLGINVEIKPATGHERETVQQTLTLLRNYWPQDQIPALLSSSSKTCLKLVRELDQEIALGYILHSWTKNWRQIVTKCNCASLHAYHRILTKKMITTVTAMDKLVLAYTVNNLKRASKLFSWGVTAVFTDYPDLIQGDALNI